MDLTQHANYLKKFPFSYKCFSPYILWLGKQSSASLDDNDLIRTLSERDDEKLEILESLLIRAHEILGVPEKEFISVFGFNNDLLTLDHEKVHDILAEPMLVVNLSDQNFKNIKKLPQFIKDRGTKIACADLTAEREGKKYAIELKTVRMENNPKPTPGKPTGNALIPYWWGTMFRNNLITKIEDKKQRVIKQLLNTKQHFSCDYTMLALYTRRIGPSTLMETDRYVEEITEIKKRYKNIDVVFFKDYFGQVIIVQ